MKTLFSISFDAWLSKLTGRAAFNVCVDEAGQDLSSIVSQKLCGSDIIATLKLPASDITNSIAAQSIGFMHVETALSFQRDVATTQNVEKSLLRFARPDDKDAVVEIAKSSFVYTRFHMDPHVQNIHADLAKASWAGNYFSGQRGDAMIVAEWEGRVSGFLQLIFATDGNIIIDLIAVKREAARQGLARKMIAMAMEHWSKNGASAFIRVGTQACNTASVNLYENMDFTLVGSQNIFHYHSAQHIENVASINK